VRFEDRLDAEVVVTAEASACRVPAFLLNPLVENAITHGRPAHAGEPLRVRVHAARVAGDRLAITVESSGTLASPTDGRGAAGGGLGLRNVRERLAHHYPGTHRFVLEARDGIVRAAIDIPASCDPVDWTADGTSSADGTRVHVG